jgi:hypothetical protein
LQAAVNEPGLAAREIAPGDGITLAEPNPAPSSPKGLVILGLAVWLDRREASRQGRDELPVRTGGNSRYRLFGKHHS